MLSTLHAAELQFRHETAERERERALITAIRARNEAIAAPVARRKSAAVVVTPAVRPLAWPRPIVAHVEATDCGVCVAA